MKAIKSNIYWINLCNPIAISIFILFLIISDDLPGQDIPNLKFDRISSENIKYERGLSQNVIYCILQDNEGFMWFGTWDGLNRYDGYSFDIYTMQEGMSNATIRSIMEDNKHQIWIGTESGLNLLNQQTGEITVLKHNPEESNSLSNDFITHVCQSPSGHIWICTSNGLNGYDQSLNVFSHHDFYSPLADSSRSNFITKAVLDDDGYLWIGTRYGLFRMNIEDQIFIPFFNTGDPNSISDNEILDICQDHHGYIWVGTANGLNQYDINSDQFTRYFHQAGDPTSLSDNRINVVYEDTHGLLWIGTNNKLNIFMRETGQFIQYPATSKNTSLSNDDIQSIYEDDANNIWIGTYKGVNKFDRSSSKFTHFNRSFETPNTLSSNIVYGVLKDSHGLLWLATRKGVNVLDRETGEYRMIHYPVEEGLDLAEARIRAVLEDKNGNYWIGSEDFGLFKYEQAGDRFTNYRHDHSDPTSISDNGVLDLIEGSDGKLWIGTYGGLNVFDPDHNTFQSYQNNPKDHNSLSHDVVWSVYEDRQGNIWLGTYLGLNRFIKESGIFIRYIYDAEDEFSISNNNIASVYEDENGIYWIATMGGGLNRFDPSTEKFTAFTIKDGLPNNVTYATLEDNNGNFWIPTNWGLSKFNRGDSSFINYDVLDGLQGNEFNGNGCSIGEDGEIFVGGMNGFNAFYPEEIKHNTKIPKVVVTAFKIFNQDLSININDKDTILLDYNDNFFSIEFTALDFTNPLKNRYMFKLDNYDIDWVQRDANRRIAEYANVRPGSYTFNVQASNNDGVWNEIGFSLSIIITPPWWATWAFRIPFAVFVILTTWYLIYRRFKNIRAKHEVEKKMLQFEKQLFDIEQKALRLQMNPHFIFNSLNAIQSFVIANDTDKAIHYLAKFSQLMRLILSNSRESHIPLKDELKSLVYFMDIERLRFDNKFEYEVKKDPKIDEEFMAIPPMIIQPYVENAILHGLIHQSKKGRISIDFKLRKDTIFCVIEDNGIGREEAMKIREASGIKRKSKGMLITKERIDLLNKQYKDKYAVQVIDLNDPKGKSLGTRVEITMVYIDL